MKSRFYILFLLFILSIISVKRINAQAGTYTFATSTGAVLTTMAGSTQILGTSQDDVTSAVTVIPFTFTFCCTNYTQFSASSNGVMGLGATAVTTNFSNGVASSATYPIIMPFWDDMNTSTTGKVHYLVTGGSPNRVLTVEWLFGNNAEAAAGYKKRVQVRLYETTNVIEIVYGPNTGAVPVSGSVGIASSAASYQSVTTSSNTSSNSTPFDVNTTWPASGRMYTFAPVGMTFSSATVTQASVANVTRCDVDQPIVCLQVVTTGFCPTTSLTQIKMQMLGTAPTTDVSLIHVYYTGTTSTFSAIGAFNGAGTAVAAGTITINGAQALANGTNYFWIAYDMSLSGVIGNNVDAMLLSPATTLTVGGVAQIVVANNPAGVRNIVGCTGIGPGAVSTNLAFWIKANTGTSSSVDNTAITQWNDNSGNTRNATQATLNREPLYKNNTTDNINNNPIVKFDGVAGSGDYMDITANGAMSTGDNAYSYYVVIRPGTQHNTTPGTIISGGAGCGTAGDQIGCDIKATNKVADRWDSNDNNSANNVFSTLPFLSSFTYNNTAAGLRTMYINGVSSITKVGIGRTNTNASFAIGCQRGCGVNSQNFQGDIAEIVSYGNLLTNTIQQRRIESYLCLKYGITLGNNGSTTAKYESPYGTTIWNSNTGYHYDVTGIGADNTNEALQQNKSKNVNVPTASGASDMPFTIAHDLITAPTNIADNTYIIVGHNNDVLSGYPSSFTHGGAAIQVYQMRIFRIQTTNLTGGHSVMNMVNLEIEFDMSKVPGNTGGYGLSVAVNDPVNLRLLLDDNTTFGQGTAFEKAYSTSGVTGNVAKFLIPVNDLPINGTMFMRIASVNGATTPLPIELLNFNSTCANNIVDVDWSTATETNTNYFAVERSSNAIDFSPIGTVNAAGNSSQVLHYHLTDYHPLGENSYYRLSEIDKDGKSIVFASTAVSCANDPNDLEISNSIISDNQLTFTCSTSFEGNHMIYVYDDLGNLLISDMKYFRSGENIQTLDMSQYSNGMFIIHIVNEHNSVTKKVMIVR